MSRSRAAEAGFSLMELLVVVIIIGILAGTVMPKMIEFMSQADIDNAVNQMALTLRRLRQEAIRNRGDVCMELDLSANAVGRMWVDRDGGSDFDVGEPQLPYGGYSFPPAIDLAVTGSNSGPYTICYNWRGNATNITIQLGTGSWTSANYENWRSWTFTQISGFYRYYPCGRNSPFAANDC